MRLTSHTGLMASVSKSKSPGKRKIEPTTSIELRCEVTPAPYMLRPYAGLYNPFSHRCSVLCNHPADTEAKKYVKRVKDALVAEGKNNYVLSDDGDKEKIRTPHDIVTEDMFRRYTETDSRPLTPAPTLASAKSRSSRRCLTPDQPHPRTTIVVDLRRSHSQETLYYHGHTTSEMTGGNTTSPTNDRSTLPSLNLSEATHNRLIKGQVQQLPPLASPLVLAKRTPPVKAMNVQISNRNQLKALNLGKAKGKTKAQNEAPGSQPAKDKDSPHDGSETAISNMDDGGSGESRRRGKRRRKGRQGTSDRLTSAGLAAQTQQDPETQSTGLSAHYYDWGCQSGDYDLYNYYRSKIAGIGTDSHNPSSRGSIALPGDDDMDLPVIKATVVRKNDSFLDDDILKFLHREVDEEAIETEFDSKRRYVLEEALRTRPERSHNAELQKLVQELHVPAVSLGEWLHVPRVFSRQNSQFTLPIDSKTLEQLTPMQYATRFVSIQKSKQLLYLTVLRKFKPQGYRMPVKNLEEGLILMMGSILTPAQASQFRTVMQWDSHQEEETNPEDIKFTSLVTGRLSMSTVNEAGDTGKNVENTLKYRTWCGLCAICERMYGRFPPRDKDPPNGIELSDFTMIETTLAVLKVNSGLVEILNTIRVR